MAKKYLKDFHQGATISLGKVYLSKEAIIEFAQKYDPQPFHLDEAAAKPIFGSLIASGWQTASLCQSLLVKSVLNDTASLGSPGVSELRFHLPVLPNQYLEGLMHIIEVRPSKSKPFMGLVTCRMEMRNEAAKIVLSMVGTFMVETGASVANQQG